MQVVLLQFDHKLSVDPRSEFRTHFPEVIWETVKWDITESTTYPSLFSFLRMHAMRTFHKQRKHSIASSFQSLNAELQYSQESSRPSVQSAHSYLAACCQRHHELHTKTAYFASKPSSTIFLQIPRSVQYCVGGSNMRWPSLLREIVA